MSTFTTLNMALTGARQVYNAYADFRDRKVDEAYGALSSAAETYGPKADDAVESARHAYDDSMKKAGAVTKAARVRLEKAIAAAEEKGGSTLKDVRSSGEQLNRKARRKAAKLDKSARKNTSRQLARVGGDKKESHWVRNLAVAALTASGFAAVVYAVMNKRKDVPGTTPPRVEDQASSFGDPVQEDEPVLVYSTQTGDDAPSDIPVEDIADEVVAEAEATAVAAADLNADVETENEAEADLGALTEPDTAEELVEELSEAEAIQAEFDTKNAPQRDKDK